MTIGTMVAMVENFWSTPGTAAAARRPRAHCCAAGQAVDWRQPSFFRTRCRSCDLLPFSLRLPAGAEVAENQFLQGWFNRGPIRRCTDVTFSGEDGHLSRSTPCFDHHVSAQPGWPGTGGSGEQLMGRQQRSMGPSSRNRPSANNNR